MRSESRFMGVCQYTIQSYAPHDLIPHIRFDYLGGWKAGNSVQCVVGIRFKLVSLP